MFVDLENVEGVEPNSSYKEGYPKQNGSSVLRKGGRSLRDREKTNLDQKSNKVSPQISHSTRVHVDQKNIHSQHLRTYNSLLNDGR